MRERCPWPVHSTTSVEACAKAIVNGAEKRKDRIFIPRSARLVFWLRNVINSAIGERVLIRDAAELMPRMDAEVAALGRAMSARTAAINEAEAEPSRSRRAELEPGCSARREPEAVRDLGDVVAEDQARVRRGRRCGAGTIAR